MLLAKEPITGEVPTVLQAAIHAIGELLHRKWPAQTEATPAATVAAIESLYRDGVREELTQRQGLNRIVESCRREAGNRLNDCHTALVGALDAPTLQTILPTPRPQLSIATVQRATNPERPLDRNGAQYHTLVRALSVLTNRPAKALVRLPLFVAAKHDLAVHLIAHANTSNNTHPEERLRISDEFRLLVEHVSKITNDHINRPQPLAPSAADINAPELRYDDERLEFRISIPITSTVIYPTSNDYGWALLLISDFARRLVTLWSIGQCAQPRIQSHGRNPRIGVGIHIGTSLDPALRAMQRSGECQSGIVFTKTAHAHARTRDLGIAFETLPDKARSIDNHDDDYFVQSFVSEIYYEPISLPTYAEENKINNHTTYQIFDSDPSNTILGVEASAASLSRKLYDQSINISTKLLSLDPACARAHSHIAIANAHLAEFIDYHELDKSYAPNEAWYTVADYLDRALLSAMAARSADPHRDDADLLVSSILLLRYRKLFRDVYSGDTNEKSSRGLPRLLIYLSSAPALDDQPQELVDAKIAKRTPAVTINAIIRASAIAHLNAARRSINTASYARPTSIRRVLMRLVLEAELAKLYGDESWTRRIQPHPILEALGWNPKPSVAYHNEVLAYTHRLDLNILHQGARADLRFAVATILSDFAGNPTIIQEDGTRVSCAEIHLREAYRLAGYFTGSIRRGWWYNSDRYDFMQDVEKALTALSEGKSIYERYLGEPYEAD